MDSARSLSHKRRIITILIFAILVVFTFLISLSTGAQKYTISEIIYTLFNPDDSKIRMIVFNVRLPRIVISCLVGIFHNCACT